MVQICSYTSVSDIYPCCDTVNQEDGCTVAVANKGLGHPDGAQPPAHIVTLEPNVWCTEARTTCSGLGPDNNAFGPWPVSL